MAKQEKQETITFHNTPAFYVAYMDNWLQQKKKDAKANPAETAIVEDIAKLVKLAVNYLAPVPAEPETK